ncbi:MAG: exo-alpha-sialidase, partial [Candidatus Aminicenantes bacterium]|nr:exo-alpha-sialidase [Candidatus Aminicenantes bacterium]
MIRLTQVSFIFLMIFIFSLCSPSPDPVPDNPVPALTSISPTSKVSHMPDFTLTAIGTNFVSGSRIIFNGASKPTTYVSPTEVTCQVGPTDITANLSIVYDYEDLSGALSSNVPVLVNNPAPGGGDSNSVNFTINDNHTFYVPGNISNNAGSSRHPAIAVDSAGNINVVWRDNTDILFSHSTDGGSSWSAAVNISNNSGDSYKPAITVDSAGNINVAWQDISPGNWDIFFSRSTDSGSSWSAAVNISNNSGHSLKPAIIVDSAGNINVAWYDYTPGNYDIFFRHSTDNGSSWSAAVNISNNSVYSSYPAITVDSAGNINVAWYDYTPGNYDIFFRRSTDSGSSWSAAVNISNNSGDSYNPAITVDS